MITEFKYNDVMYALREAHKAGNTEDAARFAKIANDLRISGKAPKEYEWSEVPVAAAKNLVKNSGEVGASLLSAVNPANWDEMAEGAIELGSAALEKILPESVLKYAPKEKREKAQQVGSAVDRAVYEAVGTEENLKRTLAEKPVDTALMFSGITGIAGNVSKLKPLTTISKYTDPITGALKLGEYGVPKILKGARSTAEYLMQSALKPTASQIKSGQAATAVNTMLDLNLNATKGGIEKLKTRIDNVNNKIKTAIGSKNVNINKQNVLDEIDRTYTNQYSQQINPSDAKRAFESTKEEFLKGFPDEISVQQAQKIKQGTYKDLGQKAFTGQKTTEAVAADKAGARGLKNEIERVLPDQNIKGLNAEEGKLLDTLDVAERRVIQQANNNPGGLAWLASNPASFIAFMADKSAAFKSIMARMVNNAQNVIKNVKFKPQLKVDGQKVNLLDTGAIPKNAQNMTFKFRPIETPIPTLLQSANTPVIRAGAGTGGLLSPDEEFTTIDIIGGQYPR